MVFKRQIKNNTYSDKGDYFEVTVNNSDFIYKVDSEDVEWMKHYTWFSDKGRGLDYPYLVAKKRIDSDEYKRITIKFHIEIMQNKISEFKDKNPEYKKRIIIDHINGDITDNRKDNLRVRTQSENNMNKKIQSNNTSGFVGVVWHSKQKMWNASITVRGEVLELGSYYYLRNALRARIEAEGEYFGEHAFYLRDEDYAKNVEKVLSLPYKPEPIFIGGPISPVTGVKGVKYDKGRKRKNYIAHIEGLPSKSFDTLEEAVKHREFLWKQKHGDRPPMHSKDKEEKLI